MKVLSHLVTGVVSAAVTLAVVHGMRSTGTPPGGEPTAPAVVAETPDDDAARVAPPSLQGSPNGGLESATEVERRFLEDALAKERARREAAEIRPADDGLQVLERVLEHRADPAPLLRDFERFQSHVAKGAVAPVRYDATDEVTVISGGRQKPKDPLVIELGPGRFRFDRVLDYWRHQMDEVMSAEIQGAGMDETTVFVKSGTVVSVRQALENLRISDITFETKGESLVHSNGDVSVVLERVRLEGTEYGQSSTPLYLAGRFYLGCRSCEFRNLEAPVQISGQGIALFDRCTFTDVESGFISASGAAQGSHVTLRDCEWHDSHVADSRMQYRRQVPEYVVEVDGGSVAMGRARWSDEQRRERWGASWVREVRPPSFRASDSAHTLAVMVRILEEAPLAAGQKPTALKLIASPWSGPARYLLTARNPATKHDDGYEAWVDPRGVEVRAANTSDSSDPADGALPLAEVIRRSGEPLTTTPADRIHYGRTYVRGEYLPSVTISWRGAQLLLNASTGERIVTEWGSDW